MSRSRSAWLPVPNKAMPRCENGSKRYLSQKNCLFRKTGSKQLRQFQSLVLDRLPGMRWTVEPDGGHWRSHCARRCDHQASYIIVGLEKIVNLPGGRLFTGHDRGPAQLLVDVAAVVRVQVRQVFTLGRVARPRRLSVWLRSVR